MGFVYLAEDTLLERPVAIKFIAAQWPDPSQRSRFFTEARAVARLQHPNVVAVHRIGEVQQRPYLVQEFVRGTSLKDSPGPLPAERVLQIALGLARGLAAVHREHVLHRDVKPSNILLLPDGGVKLLDFGLALLQHAAAGPGAEPPTPTGLVAGTPGYLAPELLRGEPPSPRSDLYALGVVLHQSLGGHRPFEESTATRSGPEAPGGAPPLLESGLSAPPGDGLEARLWKLIHRCLAYDPALRFASAEELADALHALTETPSTQGVPAGNPYRGLQAFEAEHRALFFGREAEVHGVLERLRFNPLVLVAGDSGVGKSSLCRAGVLPRVLEGALGDGRAYTGVSFMPGLQPLTALVAALARWLGMGEQELAAQVLHEPQALGRLLRAGLGPRRGLLIFVDQLEELFTQSEPREAAAFAEALGRLALPVGGVRTLMTVRGDFFTRLAALPTLGEEVVRALFLLKPLTARATREVIVGPAHRTGVAFETEALVSGLVASAASAPGGLPILQFALAELWEARDRERQLITEASLQALGGVGGALGHHADDTLAMLPAPARQAARRMLLRLMTGEGTRVRRRAEELDAAQPAHHTALEALVRARLVVARQAGGENVYEVAHEALLQGWATLRDWIAAEGARRAVLHQVEEAANAWERMGRPDSALWTRRQLSEVTGELDLKPRELAFLAASRGAVRRAWRRRAALVVMVPLAALLTWGGTWAKHRYELEREISQRTAMAHDALSEARARKEEAEAARSEAFRVLDALGERVLSGEKPTEAARFARAEALWTAAREGDRRAEEAYLLATRSLDAVLLLDSTRTQVRELLAQVLLDRITLAEWFYRPQQRGELVLRLASLDEGGASRRSLTTPPRLWLTTEPPDAEVLLQPTHRGGETGTPPAAVVLGRTPLTGQIIEPGPGSYLLTLRAPGHAPAILPVLLAPGEQLEARLPLPEVSAVPEGFVYVPPGRFLFGSSEDEALRREFLQAPPLRPLATAGYLISRYEVTFAEWITFLSALPPEERARRMPGIQSPVGALRLTQERGAWRLMLQPTTQPFTARSGEPIHYPGRTHRATQDWLRMPVSAISREDALAYLAWLDRSGRVPGARLCTEYEWERAARGADGRIFPSGDVLNPDDANFDETYGRQPLGFGPDEVGAHPASASPFGVMDLAGNVMEWVRSVRDPDEAVVRVGAWYYDRLSNRSNNRLVVEPMLRDLRIGLRVCAGLR